jgi:chaperonin GroEL (HSP60 family)
MTGEPIDLRKAGVLDPTLVIKEVVRNAASVSSKLITVGATIAYEDDLMEVRQ